MGCLGGFWLHWLENCGKIFVYYGFNWSFEMSDNQEKLNEQLFNVIADEKASSEARLKKVKYLVRLGADVNAKDERGKTMLIRAAERGEAEVVKYFIEQGADVEQKDNFGYSALKWAVNFGYIDVVKCLAQGGANMKVKDEMGQTMLMLAAEKGHLEVVKYLAQNGANVNEKNVYEDTALDIARNWRRDDCLKFLEELQPKEVAKEPYEAKVEVLSEHKDKAKKEVLEGKAQDEKMEKGSFWKRIFGGRN